ncbi:MAG: cupin domain-containing protein [Candidatus Eremiobacteraeota bacterium]|nr:cupin domain-containing protein [Candidatus Eremiobacteraeota bacterium]
MQKTIVPDVWTWKRWQADRSMDFNSWFVKGDANVAIDPLEPDAEDLAQIDEMGGVSWVIVTNRDHERATRAFVDRFEAKVAASDLDAGELSVAVTQRLTDGEVFQGWRVIQLDGFKSPGEIALYSLDRKTLVLGDSLWGDPAGSLRFGAEKKLADLKGAALSLRAALAVPHIEHVLVGDGVSIFGGGRKAIVDCIHDRALPDALRINLADVPTQLRAHHDGYRAASGDVGFMLGAERLGYRILRLEPGDAFCPLHWHTREEELLIVFDGSPTLLHPAGNLQLAKGDFVAFPTGATGAHKLRNDGKETCTIFLLANVDQGDVCFYPDSKKVMVEYRGLIVRSEPELAYFDGE